MAPTDRIGRGSNRFTRSALARFLLASCFRGSITDTAPWPPIFLDGRLPDDPSRGDQGIQTPKKSPEEAVDLRIQSLSLEAV